MSTQHTPGSLRSVETRVYLPNLQGGFDIRDSPNPEANARRIVACWNACEGLSTESLERSDMLSSMNQRRRQLENQRDQLLEALRNYVAVIATGGGGDKDLFMSAIREADNAARATIAKATGAA